MEIITSRKIDVILLHAEDDDDNFASICHHFEGYSGILIQQCKTAEECGKELMDSNPFRQYLLDLRLKGDVITAQNPQGVKVIRKIKAGEPYKNPIILTGYPDHAKKCYELGIPEERFITKGPDREFIDNKIKEFVRNDSKFNIIQSCSAVNLLAVIDLKTGNNVLDKSTFLKIYKNLPSKEKQFLLKSLIYCFNQGRELLVGYNYCWVFNITSLEEPLKQEEKNSEFLYEQVKVLNSRNLWSISKEGHRLGLLDNLSEEEIDLLAQNNLQALGDLTFVNLFLIELLNYFYCHKIAHYHLMGKWDNEKALNMVKKLNKQAQDEFYYYYWTLISSQTGDIEQAKEHLQPLYQRHSKRIENILYCHVDKIKGNTVTLTVKGVNNFKDEFYEDITLTMLKDRGLDSLDICFKMIIYSTSNHTIGVEFEKIPATQFNQPW